MFDLIQSARTVLENDALMGWREVFSFSLFKDYTLSWPLDPTNPNRPVQKTPDPKSAQAGTGQYFFTRAEIWIWYGTRKLQQLATGKQA